MVKMETEKKLGPQSLLCAVIPSLGRMTSLCYPGNPEVESSKAISTLSVGEAKPLSIRSVARPDKICPDPANSWNN